MAHFAKLDTDNKVTEIVVINNDVIIDENGDEQESLGINFLKSLYGNDTVWVQTSYNNNIRQWYAEIGGSYDSSADKFVGVKPYESWVFDNTLWGWKAPVDIPDDLTDEELGNGVYYNWNESTTSWDKVE